jgi:hypothetical protein
MKIAHSAGTLAALLRTRPPRRRRCFFMQCGETEAHGVFAPRQNDRRRAQRDRRDFLNNQSSAPLGCILHALTMPD